MGKAQQKSRAIDRLGLCARCTAPSAGEPAPHGVDRQISGNFFSRAREGPEPTFLQLV